MKIYFLYTILYANTSENVTTNQETFQIIDNFHEEFAEDFLCSCKYLTNHIENVNDDFFTKFSELLSKNLKPCWNFFKKSQDFSHKEIYFLTLLFNSIKEKNYENFTKILCKLQIYEKVYEFIKDALEGSKFFNKDYFNKQTCIKKLQNFIKENKEPLVENDNILYACEILNTIYYHLLTKKEKHPKYILYSYQQLKIQITYEKNQYDVNEKKIDELVLNFKNLDINNQQEFVIHEKYYKNLVKFVENF
jgi:hypothetical protein